MDTPQFEHDCDTCTFLGRCDGNTAKGYAEAYDLYVCPQWRSSTVIARFDDDGPNYMSGISIAVSLAKAGATGINGQYLPPEYFTDHPLVVAYRRAIEVGLIDSDGKYLGETDGSYD